MVENSRNLSAFYDTGLPRFKGEFSNDQMHGFWEFYRKDGSLMRSGYFEYGTQTGVWKTFDRTGKMVSEKILT